MVKEIKSPPKQTRNRLQGINPVHNIKSLPGTASLLQLQKTIGNQAVVQLLEKTKLKTSSIVSFQDYAASVPIQRLILGEDGHLDTQNDSDREQILVELRTMDASSLRYIRELLNRNDAKDYEYIKYINYLLVKTNVLTIEETVAEIRALDEASLRDLKGMLNPQDQEVVGYINLIDYELEKSDLLNELSQVGNENIGSGAGIFTSAAVFIDGNLIGRTEPISHPTSDTTYYEYVLNGGTEHEQQEEHVSRHDGEVATLEEAYYLIEPLSQHFTGDTQIRVLLGGVSGPCDGCKRRLEKFKEDILEMLPSGAILSIESSYLNSTIQKERNSIPTRYGYENQTQERSVSGDRYYNYKYPLNVKH